MATETTRLPIVDCVRVSKQGESAKKEDREINDATRAPKNEEVAAFLASVRLGSLERQPRPGDVFRRSRHAPPSVHRPLGLIPDRGDPSNIYSGFLPPIFPETVFTSMLARTRLRDREEAFDCALPWNQAAKEDSEGTSVVFRHQAMGKIPSPASHGHAANASTDGEYADTKMQDYVAYVAQKQSVNAPFMNRHRRKKTVLQTGTRLLQYPDSRTGCVEYVNFINQADMTSKTLYLDQRIAAECGVCERCRGRMGRCARCLALRVGGGYIILDGSELLVGRSGSRNRKQPKWSGRLDNDQSSRSQRKEFGSGALHDASHVTGNGGGDARRGDVGGRGEWGGGEGSGGGGWGEGGSEMRDQKWGGVGYDSASRAKGDGRGRNEEGEKDGHTGSGREGSGLWDGDGMDSGRQSNLSQRPGSRMTGSRPGSRFGMRPPSSMRRLGRNTDHRKRGVNVERQSGGEGWGGDGGGGEGEDGDDGDGRRSRRRRRGGREGGEGDNGDGGQRFSYGYGHDDDNLMETKSGSLGDLMRFRNKRDDVKALKATLKELQDIDPLDYLAKYCIIDQEKVPHYQRVYDNVDRDEDDEIDILELDFALKAVNFDLISDSELTYVHSVLELAGRHKLNFRFFSLIAALSEKVVALDGMVKRLINKMDFEALEVKLKKCKELFYLLADAEHDAIEQGGVVTVSSLAVELQAGGLTQEHVDYVCDHMNREDRGLVEFLDYLTYVPLFVEIHDNIYDNPLDFTRTK